MNWGEDFVNSYIEIVPIEIVCENCPSFKTENTSPTQKAKAAIIKVGKAQGFNYISPNLKKVEKYDF